MEIYALTDYRLSLLFGEAPRIRKKNREKLMLVTQCSERHTNNFFFTDFLTCATDFAEKQGLLVV